MRLPSKVIQTSTGQVVNPVWQRTHYSGATINHFADLTFNVRIWVYPDGRAITGDVGHLVDFDRHPNLTAALAAVGFEAVR